MSHYFTCYLLLSPMFSLELQIDQSDRESWSIFAIQNDLEVSAGISGCLVRHHFLRPIRHASLLTDDYLIFLAESL
jgi:hypothetical protein